MAFEKITNESELRNEVDIVLYLESLDGVELPKNVSDTSFKINCLLPDHTHGSDSLSLVIYPKNNRWQCMSPNQPDKSRQPQSIWDLCMAAEGLCFRDAVYRVCEVCGADDLIETDTVVAVKMPPSGPTQDAAEGVIESSKVGLDELFSKTVGRLQFGSSSNDGQNPVCLWLAERFDQFGDGIDEWIKASGVLDNLAYDPAHDSVVAVERNSEGDIVNTRHEKKFVYDPEQNQLNKAERMAGKWFHAAGQPLLPYVLNITKDEEPVLIVEGVTDRLAAQIYGLNVLAINSAATVLNGDDRLAVLAQKKCILYPDADQAGAELAKRVQKLADEIGAELRVVPWADILEKERIRPGFDVADFVGTYTEYIPKLLDPDWLTYRKQMRKYGAITADPSGPQKTFEQRLEDYINADFIPLKMYAVSMICAPGGTGKYFLVLMALMRYVIDQRRPALYIAVEEDTEDINDRIRHIIQTTWNLEGDDRATAEGAIKEQLYVMSRGSGFGAIRDASKPGYEVDAIKREELRLIMSGVDFLVLDPLISFYGGRENDNGEARIFMDTLNDLAAQTKTTVMLVHHSAKGNDDNTKSRGASAFIDAARLSYSLRKIAESDEERAARLQAAKKSGMLFDINRFRELCLTKTNSNVSEVIKRNTKRYKEVLSGNDSTVVRVQLW